MCVTNDLALECKSDVSDSYSTMGSSAEYTQEVTLLSAIAAVIYGCF